MAVTEPAPHRRAEPPLQAMLRQDLNRLASFDHGVCTPAVEAVFRHVKHRLIEFIREADMVIGAVAWLTDADVLAALAQRPSLLVIQKEDFLRPDMASVLMPQKKAALRAAYERLGTFDGTRVTAGPFSQGVPGVGAAMPAVLCFGSCLPGQMFRMPRMHNKFIVLLKETAAGFSPQAVWTGSFNFTELSRHSLENALIVRDPVIAEAYAAEAQAIYLLGEPLDWTLEWARPQTSGPAAPPTLNPQQQERL